MSDHFDEHLRARLGRRGPTAPDPHETLVAIAPRLRHARRRARLQAGAAALGVVAALGLAGTWLWQPGPDVQHVAAAGSTDQGDGATPLSSQPMPFSDDDTMPPVSGRSDDGSSTTVPLPDGLSSGSSESAPSSSVPTSVPPSPTSSRPTTTTPTTSAPATTVPPSSSSAGSSSTTITSTESVIESPCGSIVVAVDGAVISLIGVAPGAGFVVEENNAGPEAVEVSFEGPANHCEIKADVRNGQLWTEVETE